MTNLTELVQKYHNSLTKKEIDYLTKFNFTTSNFYGLPKVRTLDKIAEAVNAQHSECIRVFEPDNLTLRPVVAGPNCPTKRLITFIDIIIKPLILHVKGYIRDSIDFLQKCSRTAKESTVICTFDVKSLYTNIPHEFGLQAMNFWLKKHEASINSRFPKAFILESIQFILKNNNFKFNEEYFKQLVGTAIGTDMAPTYATLTMGYYEKKLYAICKVKWGEEIGSEIEKNWGRFLDDCEIPVNEDKVDPKDLLEVLNSIDGNLQFTMQKSKEMVPLLDILIRKDGTKIWTDSYTKPTDTRRYLPFSSSHPKHCKVNIPFCLARRICMIVENENAKKRIKGNLAPTKLSNESHQ